MPYYLVIMLYVRRKINVVLAGHLYNRARFSFIHLGDFL